MSTHTPEPWSVGVGVDAKCGRHRAEVRTDNIPLPIASTMFFGITPQEECEANAARIVACVNALADRDPSKLADLEKEMECAIACLSAIGATRPADNLAAALAAFRPNPPKRSPGPRLIAGMNKLRDRVKSGEFRKEAP